MSSLSRQSPSFSKQPPAFDAIAMALRAGFLSIYCIWILCNMPELEPVVANPQNWGTLVLQIATVEELQYLEFIYSHFLRLHRVPIHIQLAMTGECAVSGDMLRRIAILGDMVKKLDLSCCYNIRGIDLKHLKRLTSLQELNLYECISVNDAGLDFLAEQPLRVLELRGCHRITDNGIRNMLRQSPLLRRLDLSLCNAVVNGIGNLSELNFLTHLSLERYNETSGMDSFINCLAGLKPTLLTLNLRNNKLEDPDIVELVTRQPNIRDLNLGWCTALTGTCLASLSALKGLQYLDLAGCKGTPDGLAHLSGLMFLQSLNLCGCDITDKHIQYLAEVKSLGYLNLSQCSEITQIGASYLKRLEFLRVLNLRNCRRLGNRAMKHLAEIKLQSLNVGGCQIGDSDVAILAGMKTLRSLCLSACRRITDAGIAHLAGSGLHSLDLSACCGITYDGVCILPALLELNLDGCLNVSL